MIAVIAFERRLRYVYRGHGRVKLGAALTPEVRGQAASGLDTVVGSRSRSRHTASSRAVSPRAVLCF